MQKITHLLMISILSVHFRKQIIRNKQLSLASQPQIEWEKRQMGRGSSNLKFTIGEMNFTYESIDNSKLEEG